MSAISSEKHKDELIDQLSRCAYSIGYCLGDGHLGYYREKKNGKWYPTQCVVFSSSDRDALEVVQEEINNVFGRKYAITHRILKSGTSHYTLSIYRKDIFHFFSVNTEMKSIIPEPFFSMDHDSKRKIIAGLFDSDGYVSQRKSVTNRGEKQYIYNRWDVGFANTKYELTAGVASLLKSLGVKVGKIGTYQKGNYRIIYRIQPNIRDFVESGCFFKIGRKSEKLHACLQFMLGSETSNAAPLSKGEGIVHQIVKAI